MPMLQELAASHVQQTLAQAVEKNMPAVVTVRSGDSWDCLRSRLLGIRDGQLQMEIPQPAEGNAPYEFVPGQEIGISFKVKHHKHLASATVVGIQQLRLNYAFEIPVLAVSMPRRMQRLQRRAYLRADVPANRIVRASFWLGGSDCEPRGGSIENPVWSGQVLNISAGGLQINTNTSAAESFDVGDLIGLRIAFGAGSDQVVFADAQFRHTEKQACESEAGHRLLVGLQFVGLDQTIEGREALELISRKVSEFHRLNGQ